MAARCGDLQARRPRPARRSRRDPAVAAAPLRRRRAGADVRPRELRDQLGEGRLGRAPRCRRRAPPRRRSLAAPRRACRPARRRAPPAARRAPGAASVQPELADQHQPPTAPRGHRPRRGEHRDRDAEIEPATRLGTAAGDSPPVMRRFGHCPPLLTIAARTRSRALAARRCRAARRSVRPRHPCRQVGLDLDEGGPHPDEADGSGARSAI